MIETTFNIVNYNKRKNNIYNNYSASGVLVYRLNNNKVEVLLGYDIQKRGFTVPGGKRDSYEHSPIQTARREFYEETGGILSDDTITLLLENTQLIPFNKYILFVSMIDTDEKKSKTDNIEEQFRSFTCSERYNTSPNMMKEMSCLKWISISDLLSNKIPITGLLRKFFYNYHVKKIILQYEL